MMTVVDVIEYLVRMFPAKPPSADTLREYAGMLAEHDASELMLAARELVKTSEAPWFPTVGQILAALKRMHARDLTELTLERHGQPLALPDDDELYRFELARGTMRGLEIIEREIAQAEQERDRLLVDWEPQR